MATSITRHLRAALLRVAARATRSPAVAARLRAEATYQTRPRPKPLQGAIFDDLLPTESTAPQCTAQELSAARRSLLAWAYDYPFPTPSPALSVAAIARQRSIGRALNADEVWALSELEVRND